MRFVMIGVALGLTVALAACSGSQKTGTGFADTMKEAPKWAKLGCMGLSGEKKKWICGVGAISGTNNLPLCRTESMARGRTDIARQLNLKVKAMVKDYQATVTGGGQMGRAADDEQYVADVAKQITDMSLPGTRVEDMWFSDRGDCFALMVLDTDAFTEAVGNLKTLDSQVRDHVIKNAEKAFRELDRTTEQPQ